MLAGLDGEADVTLNAAGGHAGLVTTDLVWAELDYAFEIPGRLDVVEIDPDAIDPQIRAVAEQNRGEVDPDDKASVADLSLVQALVEEPRYRGVITEDDDLVRMHVPSIVEELTDREVRCMTSAAFVERHPGWFEGG